ncbi:hypothetical protein FOH10_30400 [Nocardia otitidiscaviarum]|uniref:Uncharacterized protein n=1 Tax=Nocardia otitidiscaviarum TaxID=1823 RepID=A0A516NU64_9NOCA|nr:hypothetical protein [Nocardia otitidiscaviarum]MCP9621764.1 hypothetical protein [Nocardia otitidiscaviarum]QDP82401.1 hypothetical protein FOH10_30400 [Nocardia otitidiscaviarum]
MGVPARRDDGEDARKLRLAPDDDGPRYLQHADGTWSMVGPDGWPVSLDEYAELHADAMSAIAAVAVEVIDVEPISVRDSEIR